MKPILILYLEDSDIDADLALSLLEKAGISCQIERVQTEDEFKAALQRRCHDLILADYVLPGFDGMSALEMAQQRCPEVPFVFVSGAIGEEVAIESLHRGATDYVVKQRMARLAPAVRRAMAEAEERKARKRAEEQREALLVSERQARAEAETQAQRLAEVNAELEQFAYAASHDLQEPLRMVKLYAQLLTRRYRPVLDGDGVEFLDYVVQGATRMEKLMRDLLSYSRTIHDQEDRLQPVDLGVVLRQTLDEFHQRIDESGATVTVGPLPTVLADSERIGSVFQNLLSNSLKYRNSHSPQIDVSAKREDGRWVVTVRDNGIGFQQEFAEQIFGLFKRLHREQFPGTGVGLALARRIVEQHGGRIWAESTPGQGATFHFTLRAPTDGPGDRTET